MPILNTILNLIFPIKCLGCGKKQVELCPECLSGFPPAERECPRWIFPLYEYRYPPVRKAIWLLKYQGKKNIGNILGEAMYGRIVEELADLALMENFREPILIPIPLSRSRKRERGFNQAEILAQKVLELAQIENLTLEKDILIKPRDSVHQAHVENRAKRMQNIIGSFKVEKEERIRGRNIILIDDVLTTGATLSEARKVLREAGAKKVIAFTAAH